MFFNDLVLDLCLHTGVRKYILAFKHCWAWHNVQNRRKKRDANAIDTKVALKLPIKGNNGLKAAAELVFPSIFFISSMTPISSSSHTIRRSRFAVNCHLRQRH